MGKPRTNKGKNKTEKAILKTNLKNEARLKKRLARLGEQDIAEIVANLEAEEARLTTVVVTPCAPPTPRTNPSLCASPAGTAELILFGGEFDDGRRTHVYNDLFVYATGDRSWRSVRSPAGPVPRSSHQMVASARNGGELWLFGGEHPSPSQMQFHHFNDLWVFRLAEQRWHKVQAPKAGAQQAPSPRSGHRMVEWDGALYVFGGFHDSGVAFTYHNDVWRFDMAREQWAKLKCEGFMRPAPRSAGSMAVTPDGRLLVWGGYSRSAVKKNVDRGVTHVDMFALAQDKSDASGLTWTWTMVRPGGPKPAPRSGVGLCVVPGANAIGYTFGGVLDVDEDEENVKGDFSNEMHAIDLAKCEFAAVRLSAAVATAGSGGAAGEPAEDGKMELDEATKATSRKSTAPASKALSMFASAAEKKRHAARNAPNPANVPSPRMKCSMVVCGEQLYLYGGIVEDGSKQTTMADFYSLDLTKMDKWTTIVGQDANHEFVESDDDDDDSEKDDKDGDDSDSDDSDDDSDDDSMDE